MKQTALILIILLLAIPVIIVSTLSPLAIIYHSELRINDELVERAYREERGGPLLGGTSTLYLTGYTITASVIWSYEDLSPEETTADAREWSYRIEIQAGYWEPYEGGRGWFGREILPGQRWTWKDKGTSFTLIPSDYAGSTVEHKATIDLRESWSPDFEPNSFKLTLYRTWSPHEEGVSQRVYLVVGEAPDEPPDDWEGDTGDLSSGGENEDYEYDSAWGVKLPVIAVVGIIGTVIVLVYRKR